MRDILSKKWIMVILIAILLALVMGIVGTLSEGRATPASNIINTLISPVQKLVTSVQNVISNTYDRLYKYDQLALENLKLSEELRDAKKLIINAERVTIENEHLRRALEMKLENPKLQFETAEVISYGNDNLSRTFTIDKGSNAGIHVDDCVITAAGMVGYVSEVGMNWAAVTSVIDTSMEAAAIVARTREAAIIEGDFELMKTGEFKLSYLARDTQLVPGDIVLTSGMGGLYPKDLILGTIREIKLEPHGISKYAVVTPAVNYDKIQQVLVITQFEIGE